MVDVSGRDDVREVDAAALKALAHPLRVQLLEQLRAESPATASQLAERLGETSGATSYHLRQLARHGLISEDTTCGRGRERWWRPDPRMLSIRGFDFLERDDTREDAAFLLREIYQSKMRRLAQWNEEGPDWPREWREAAEETDMRLFLTRDELAALTTEVFDVLDRYRRSSEGKDTHREGAEQVMVQFHAFPQRRGSI